MLVNANARSWGPQPSFYTQPSFYPGEAAQEGMVHSEPQHDMPDSLRSMRSSSAHEEVWQSHYAILLASCPQAWCCYHHGHDMPYDLDAVATRSVTCLATRLPNWSKHMTIPSLSSLKDVLNLTPFVCSAIHQDDSGLGRGPPVAHRWVHRAEPRGMA